MRYLSCGCEANNIKAARNIADKINVFYEYAKLMYNGNTYNFDYNLHHAIIINEYLTL